MNPARTFGPDLVATDFTSYWVYVAGPLVGAVRRRPRRLRCGTGNPFHGSRAPGQGVKAKLAATKAYRLADLALLFPVR
jgi:Major intrinsic protein